MAFAGPSLFLVLDQTNPKVENHLSMEAELAGQQWRETRNLAKAALSPVLAAFWWTMFHQSEGDISFRASLKR